jgi:hypothetical protein
MASAVRFAGQPFVRIVRRRMVANMLRGLVSDLSTTKLDLAYPCNTGKTCGRQAVARRWGMSFGRLKNSDLGYSRDEQRFEGPDMAAKPIQKSADLIRLQ